MLLKMVLSSMRTRGVDRVIKIESYLKIQSHMYGKFAPRKYAAIVNEDELFDVNIEDTKPTHVKRVKNLDGRLRKVKHKKTEINNTESDEQTTSEYMKEEYKEFGNSLSIHTKIHTNEKLFLTYMVNLKTKKQKKKGEQIIIEGKRIIKDAIKAKVVPEAIFFSRFDDVKDLAMLSECTGKLYKIPYKKIQVWSSLTTSPGILGIFCKPQPIKLQNASLPITIICDNVRDPGNMGSILRVAAGVGCEKVILTKGCVDLWDLKTLRSAAGTQFKVPVFASMEWTEIKELIKIEANIYLADNNSNPFVFERNEEAEIPNNEEIIKKPSEGESTVLKVVEGETEAELKTEEKERVVDEAIVTKMKSDEIYEGESVEEKSERNEIFEKQMENSKGEEKAFDSTLHKKICSLPAIPYDAVDYTMSEVVLIIGGETEGLSKEAFDLINSRHGSRVNIPLDNKIDSLNVGTALGIITFEMKRQYLLVKQKINELAQ